MCDIFISYKSEEQPMARKLADALQKEGWEVWWDPKLRAGEHFDDAIERALNVAKCIIVMWSKLSVNSRYVKDEATYALNRNKLVPIVIEEVDLPFRFEGIQTGQLFGWDSSDSFGGFQKLVTDIESILGAPPAKAEKGRRKQEEDGQGQEHEQTFEEMKRKFMEEQKAKSERTRKRGEDSSRKLKKLLAEFKPMPEAEKESKQKEDLNREEIPQKYTNNIGMNFVLIPAGSFMMGSHISPEEADRKYGGEVKLYKCEHPQHKVIISEPFYLQATAVTRGQWKEVMGDNPSKFDKYGDNCPVESISWDDAQKLIKKLNEIEGCDKYRLPSEAEWEYACRAQSTTEFSFGDEVEKLDQYAWYAYNSEGQTHPVVQKQANAWGLYDMHGNVWELVEDDWHETYDGAPSNGFAWIDKRRVLLGVIRGKYRVMRGGSWGCNEQNCRSTARSLFSPAFPYHYVGFRLAMSVAFDALTHESLALI